MLINLTAMAAKVIVSMRAYGYDSRRLMVNSQCSSLKRSLHKYVILLNISATTARDLFMPKIVLIFGQDY